LDHHSAPADFWQFAHTDFVDWRRISFSKKHLVFAIPYAIAVVAITVALITGFMARASLGSSIAWTIEGVGRSAEMQGQMYQPFVRQLASYLSDTKR
jgi:uncharacterized membrane protein